jgi:hypothetical protein
MRIITAENVSLSFGGVDWQIGSPETRARSAIGIINLHLRRDLPGLFAQLSAGPGHMRVSVKIDDCDACGNKGWLYQNQGTVAEPEMRVERCDQCCRFENDSEALASVVASAAQKFLETQENR